MKAEERSVQLRRRNSWSTRMMVSNRGMGVGADPLLLFSSSYVGVSRDELETGKEEKETG